MIFTGKIKSLTKDHAMLYDLIFKRFIASQLKECKVKVVRLKANALNIEKEIEIVTDVLEEGFNLLLPLETQPLFEGRIMVSTSKRLVQRPKAYPHTWASIVQEMKEKGIGRPSTYAMVIQTLLERGYVIERKHFLIPTSLGKTIYNFLKKKENTARFVSEEFTSMLEEEMDKIELGKRNWQELLFELYREIEDTMEKLRRLEKGAT